MPRHPTRPRPSPPAPRGVALAFLPPLLLLLAGCGSSPEPRYLTLAPVPGAAQPAGGGTVALRRVGVAGYLDRADVVVENQGYVIRIANNVRWAEPIGDMLARVLIQDLGQRLPGTLVVPEASGLGVGATDVQVDIQRFDRAPDGVVTLAALVGVTRPDGIPVARTLRLTLSSPGPGQDALVAGMSALLGRCADGIAALLRHG